MSTDTSRISPTAHYTGYVWCKNGLSHDALRTKLGRRLYTALAPANAAYRKVTGKADLEMSLLARHLVIDRLLTSAIESGRVGQVVEIAGGLSARGAKFAERYRDQGLTYVEGDLPDMAETKKSLLERAGLRGANHFVVELNALIDDGPQSLAAVAGELLDPGKGTAIITEGLTGYFSPDDLEGMWRRFALCLAGFPRGAYFADIILGGNAGSAARVFKKLLELFARGATYLHYSGDDECVARLCGCGFDRAQLHHPKAFADAGVPAPERQHIVRLIDARTGA
jgi:O-methyltransferase involved in polyketide biosynthesis